MIKHIVSQRLRWDTWFHPFSVIVPNPPRLRSSSQLSATAPAEKICNLFGTRRHSFQVGMSHDVAVEQNSCVFHFWRSHVHTRLLHSRATTNSRALGRLSYKQEEWVWNGFQDTYLSVVECQARNCDFSQGCTYTQHHPGKINRAF